MATPLGVWTLIVILYQTVICMLISAFTLQCRLAPKSSELREVTLMKLLYLYDPQSCGRVHFYNFTLKGDNGVIETNIIWPIMNPIAAAFRGKMQIWLALHIIWLFLGVLNISQGQRNCAFYATLVPFTICGVAMLVMDIVCTSVFLGDVKFTKNEVDILRYIETRGQRNILWISRMIPLRIVPNELIPHDEDTSWISLMFAYGSSRGIVQWIFNFWIIKDNYFEGLSLYRRLQKENPKLR